MKTSPIKFHITHGENTTVARIEGDAEWPHSVYFTPDDMADLTVWRKLCLDGNRIVLLEEHRMILMDTPDRCGAFGTAEDGEASAKAFIYHMDVRRFLAALRILREKKLHRVIALDSVRWKCRAHPRYTVQGLIRHPNARDGLSGTLRQFRRELPPHKWTRLVETMSSYIDRAVIFGHDQEFYFDGRRLGLGFNGGIILRTADFSIHT